MSAKVYNGSCICGDIKYQVRLTLPPVDTIGPNGVYMRNEISFDSPPNQHHEASTDNDSTAPREGTRIYKCNCSTCHKVRLSPQHSTQLLLQ